MAKKNLFIAAILNFLVWGLGYFYIRKRLGLGIGLFLAYFPAHIAVYVLGWEYYYTQLSGALIFSGHLLISLAVAYDVFEIK